MQDILMEYKGADPLSINMDVISRKVFTEMFSSYGIDLIRSSNSSNKDYTPDDKWYNITKDKINSNKKNIIIPCNN